MRSVIALIGIFAVDVATAGETGLYGGFGVSLANYDVGLSDRIRFVSVSPFGGSGVSSVPAETTSTDGSTLGWSAMVGYRVHRYFATELSYMSFGEVTTTESYRAPGASRSITSVQDIEVQGATLSVLGTLPLGDRIDLFVRGGVLFADEKVRTRELRPDDTESASDSLFLAGIGADFSFGSRWMVRAEYQLTGALDEDVNADLAEIELEQFGLTIAFKF